MIEDNENYSLIPKAILSDYKIVPEKLLDMITQSKDELNGELKEKHKLIIQGYENRINRLEEDKAALVAENERLQRQIPAKNEWEDFSICNTVFYFQTLMFITERGMHLQ